ncbi:MAG: exo-alpha-sialidase [Chloroflexi bacterium]|nr:exo-alpha-sialidase [Chloroflexota bacterium]
MPRAAAFRTVLVLVASFAFIGAVVLVDGTIRRSGADPDLARGGPGTAEVNPEAAERDETVQERREAYEAALRAGTFGRPAPVTGKPAPGWAGEKIIDATVDDWEPAIAADPNSGYVYAMTTRYGTPKPCQGNCPSPLIMLVISADNGATWAPAKPLCACKGKGQFDPIVEVVPGTGAVYALFMIEFNVVFTKSLDRGATWSAPVPTWGNVSWNDKPVLAVSDDGQDVYASFNGPTGGDPWAVQSHDGGATWTQTKLVNSGRYFYAFDADVAPDGTVYFSESSLAYTSAGNSGGVVGTIDEHVFISRDDGRTWEDRLVASVQPGVLCDAAGCGADFYVGHSALSVDAAGSVVLLYDGATTFGGYQSIYARRSTDAGATWSAPVVLSKAGETSTAPAIESRGSGDVRAWYYETSGGGNDDAWNVWYRRSTNGGASWSSPVRISDAAGGAPYKPVAGFAEVYGDYGEMAITSSGKSIAIWGEGISYTGPGGVWFNREP